eukprot:gnl/MRDRNA2_/MRDRNA2_104226_c0_seq1.p1 gnl/MRDRNA2_/MRDRNA2_104226_c0~~gnl/MRDRNA2_/MRDRNA2_104226_c0_seq1.p1  ORF type:complete len:199 (-),score=10.84 gnl/MRDRNA2_/MRDRNA2_104226_c0_seq1:192-788(-)
MIIPSNIQVFLSCSFIGMCMGATCPKFSKVPDADKNNLCLCPDNKFCHRGGLKGCPTHIFGRCSYTAFHKNCEDCTCETNLCPDSTMSAKPNIDGNCLCPNGKTCFKGTQAGCRMGGKLAGTPLTEKGFYWACTDCQCAASPPAPETYEPFTRKQCKVPRVRMVNFDWGDDEAAGAPRMAGFFGVQMAMAIYIVLLRP